MGSVVTPAVITGIASDVLSVLALWYISYAPLKDYLALSSHIPSQWYIYPCDEIQPNDLDVGIGSGTSVEMGSEGTSHESRIARGVVAHEEYGGDDELDSVKIDVGEVQARPRHNPPPWFITKPHHYAEAVFLCASWPPIQLVFHMTGVGAQLNEEEPRTWVKDLFVGWVTFLVVLGIMVLGMRVIVDPQTVRLAIRRKKTTTTYEIRPVSTSSPRSAHIALRRQVCLGYLSTIVIFVSSYLGTNISQAFIGPWLVLGVVSIFMPTEDNSIMAAVVALSFIVLVPGFVGGIAYLKEGPGEPSTESGVFGDWISLLVLRIVGFSSVCQPIPLILLNLRFEATLHQTLPARTFPNPVLPITPSPFPSPIFHSSLIALLFALLSTHIIRAVFPQTWYFVPEGMGMMFVGFMITVPAVCVVSALMAWYRGVLAQWLAYKEEWLPTHEQVKGMETLLEQSQRV